MKVSQKAAVFNDQGKILALRRSATDTNRPLTWDLPGGQLEENEDLEESLRREIREEAGIEVEGISLFEAQAGPTQNGEYWVVLLYTARSKEDKVTLSYEHDQYEWLTEEEFLSRPSSKKIERFLRKL